MELKDFRSGRLVSLAIGLIVVLGGVLYFTWPSSPDEDMPPSLDFGGNGLQGAFIDKKYSFYNCEQKDVDEEKVAKKEATLTEEFGEPTIIEPGVHFYYVENTKSLDTVFLNNTLCVKDNKVFFAYYSPGEEGLEKGFHVYPKGLFQDTHEIKDPKLFKIPAYRGFLIIASKQTKGWGFKSEKKVADRFPKPLENKEAGWVQVVKVGELKAALEEYEDRIDTLDDKPQIWVQNKDNDFAKVSSLEELANLETSYSMIWLKLKEKVSLSD